MASSSRCVAWHVWHLNRKVSVAKCRGENEPRITLAWSLGYWGGVRGWRAKLKGGEKGVGLFVDAVLFKVVGGAIEKRSYKERKKEKQELNKNQK